MKQDRKNITKRKINVEVLNMPMFPDIKQSDITISDKYTQGYDYDKCLSGLWSIYNIIKAIYKCKDEKFESSKVLNYLYCIGVFGCFENDNLSTLIVNGQSKDVKVRAYFPKPHYLFELEKFGFRVFDLHLADKGKSKSKLTIKDVLQFRISYENDDKYLLLGLKLFAAACSKIVGDPFYIGDIRILFQGASKYYAPPVNEIFFHLDEEQKQAAEAVHDKLEALGYERNLEREYMMRYTHQKMKGKTFATIYTVNQVWLAAPGQQGHDLSIKLNLRHVGRYIDYLYHCTESIQQSIIGTENCGVCKKACGGVEFTFNKVKYVKCPWHIFRFNDYSSQAVENYIKLIEFENEQLKTSSV